jgi:hypothetical protein
VRRWTAVLGLALAGWAAAALAAVPTPVPKAERGQISAERRGLHDAANIRTFFLNYGMVGDYPSNPGEADLSTFHSAEVPKGSGMNYSDGVTPFVLAKIQDVNGLTKYHMETGYRERQEENPLTARQMRFEPRPGYFDPNPRTNLANSPAISTDPRTWPSFWPDKLDDPSDPGWTGSWNGYFGKRAAADQESFTVMDDDAYVALQYFPDSRDPTRRGLGLRVEVRGFQWANPQAGNVIFWHYDITNESTADYNDNIIFGLYMDTGVGGSEWSCDQAYESDDDNAYWDRSAALNLVYTWDTKGHGRDLAGSCSNTGYLGYAYLETPGNEFDALDNDQDGILNESRVNAATAAVVGQPAILAALAASTDTVKFVRYYGPIAERPAYKAGVWFREDEDMDWTAELSDVGVDGVAETGDAGEGDLVPNQGEPNFGRTDLNESDQIGLTGFKMNRIKAAPDNPDQTEDGIVFWDDGRAWPQRLWNQFTDPNPAARFDSALAANYNIGFLFASGPFQLKAGATERFSLALAYGSNLTELRTNVQTVQKIYDANYQFAEPPPRPTLSAEAGDGYVKLSWNDVAERGIDPVTFDRDFEGYNIYRSTDPNFLDVRVLKTSRGEPSTITGKPLIQFDLRDSIRGFSRVDVEGVRYYLGDDTGITHTWTDYDVVNGQRYFYAVTAYDYGSKPDVPLDKAYFPSETSFLVSGKPRGGYVLTENVVEVRPNPRAPGFVSAATGPITHYGPGTANARVDVVATDSIPPGHHYRVRFSAPPDSIRATSYALIDSSDLGERTLFTTGAELDGRPIGVAGGGLLPVIATPLQTAVDPTRTGLRPGYTTTVPFAVKYMPGRSANYMRPGYPDDWWIEFDSVVRDTGLRISPVIVAAPAKFRVFARTVNGPRQLDFSFQDANRNGTLDRKDEFINVLTYRTSPPTSFDFTWRIEFVAGTDTSALQIVDPTAGDTLDVWLTRPFGSADSLRFTVSPQQVDRAAAKEEWGQKPYVVPNPYVGAASFEPAPIGAGRGERRIEFRSIPVGSTIRIYTVRGGLVNTIRHDGTTSGYVSWNLRNRDNLDVAPGLYVFHVDAPDVGSYVGKFAVIK